MDVVLDFEKRLLALDPIDDDFPYLVDELLDSIEQNYHQDLIPSIFKFFEKNPLNDCGMPGTLVHFVEHFDPFYLEILIESIKRKPSYNTILMTNRILNSELSVSEREDYLKILNEIVSNNSVPVELRNEAKEYLEFQASK